MFRAYVPHWTTRMHSDFKALPLFLTTVLGCDDLLSHDAYPDTVIPPSWPRKTTEDFLAMCQRTRTTVLTAEDQVIIGDQVLSDEARALSAAATERFIPILNYGGVVPGRATNITTPGLIATVTRGEDVPTLTTELPFLAFGQKERHRHLAVTIVPTLACLAHPTKRNPTNCVVFGVLVGPAEAPVVRVSVLALRDIPQGDRLVIPKYNTDVFDKPAPGTPETFRVRTSHEVLQDGAAKDCTMWYGAPYPFCGLRWADPIPTKPFVDRLKALHLGVTRMVHYFAMPTPVYDAGYADVRACIPFATALVRNSAGEELSLLPAGCVAFAVAHMPDQTKIIHHLKRLQAQADGGRISFGSMKSALVARVMSMFTDGQGVLEDLKHDIVIVAPKDAVPDTGFHSRRAMLTVALQAGHSGDTANTWKCGEDLQTPWVYDEATAKALEAGLHASESAAAAADTSMAGPAAAAPAGAGAGAGAATHYVPPPPLPSSSSSS